MTSHLRVRTRQCFGFGSNGSGYQHCYELAHMTQESELTDENADDAVWDDDLVQEFYHCSLPPIHLVEKLNLHFSDQFCYRLSWPSCSG